jgi:hypothetical protein
MRYSLLACLNIDIMENENLNDSLKRQKCIKSSLTSFFDFLKSALPTIVKVPDEFDDSDDDSDQEDEDSECSSD